MSWRRNLATMIIVQLIMLMSFSAMAPFLPFFVKELGISSQAAVSIWAGIFASVSPLFAALFSPLWGSLADRYGRKTMVVRSCFAAGTATFLISFTANVYQVLVLRILQGVFGGYSAAAIALVAAEVPPERLGYALGLLQTGQVLGLVIGPTLGGFVADRFSYPAVFATNGFLALMAGLITLTCVRERFRPPEKKNTRPLFAGVREGMTQPGIASLFLVLFLAQFAIRNIEPVLSLYVQQLAPQATHLGTLTGSIFAATGLAQVTGLLLIGRRAERLGYRRVLIVCLLASALLYFPQAFVTNAWQLLVLRLGLGIFMGCIIPMTNAIIGGLAPPETKGSIFGFTSAAIFLGNFTGPLVGGLLGASLGLRAIFLFTAALLLGNCLWTLRSVPAGEAKVVSPAAEDRAASPYELP